MAKRARDGTCLLELVQMAIPVCREAERRFPRTGPGRRPEIPDWVMAVLIMVAILKKKKSKSAQYRYLDEHRDELLGWMGTDRFPSWGTYFGRYRRAHSLFEHAIMLQGRKAITHKVVNAETVAVDKSLVAARGPLWHKTDRRRGKVPKKLRGVDTESTWGYSPHHGWVQGYSFEVVVSADRHNTVWPLLATADTASTSEHETFAPKAAQLPVTTKNVLADSGYDSNAHADAVELDEQGQTVGRRFVCKENPRNTPPPNPCTKTVSRNKTKDYHRRRFQRAAFLKTKRGKTLYARRSQTVEPFNQWFKHLFELDDRVWHRGLANNRTQILAAIFSYQLLLRYNRRKKRKNGQLQWILDRL